MERPTAAHQLLKIKNYEKGYVALTLVRTGIELGLFAAIEACPNGITASALADELELHEPYVYIWCTTAYHFELLDSAGGGCFILQPGLDEVLVHRRSPRNYQGNVNLTVDCFSKDLVDFPRYMRTGEAFPYREHGPSLSRAVAESTRNIYTVFKNIIIPGVEGMQGAMERGVDIVEFGCGSGVLMVRLAELYPKCTFSGLDVDGAGIERAQEAIREKGLQSRVSAELVGGEEVRYEAGFDYAVMMIMLHEVDPHAREGLMANCYGALKKGGRLVNVDFPYPASIEEFRQIDFERGIFDQYREMIMDHHLLTRPQQNLLATRAGFAEPHRFSVGKGMFDVMVCLKS